MDDILIEPLGDHKRGVFCCGNSSIDNFFKNNARKFHEAYSMRVFVARRADALLPLGFYALTTMTFRIGMNDEADKKFKRHDAIPTIYLTMIGRDQNSQKGLGEHMMLNAFERALMVRENVGVYALTLHAVNDAVKARYEEFGFQAFSDRAHDNDGHTAMFIPLSVVAASFNAA